MKNRYSPYYNTSDCCDDDRVNGSMNMNMGTQQSTPPFGLPVGATPATIGGGTIHPSLLQQPAPQQGPLAPIPPTGQPQAMTLESLEYLNGFLRTQIGKKVRVEFLIGTGTLVDKFGTLLGVGANYIIINQAETDDILVCDFFTIKFITFYY